MRHEWFGKPVPTRAKRLAGQSAWLARFAALFLLISALAHRFGKIGTPEFFWLLALGGLMLLAVLPLAVAALRRAWRYGEAGAGRAARAVLLALLLLTPFGVAGWLVISLPALDDLATDPLDPPQFMLLRELRGAPMNALGPIMAEEARQQMLTYPALTGRRYAAAPDTLEQAARSLLQHRGWQLRARHRLGESDLLIEASGRSMVFGLPFDIALRITDEEETSYIDMRSAIRYGAHGLGFNARRILVFLADLDLAMATLAGAGAEFETRPEE